MSAAVGDILLSCNVMLSWWSGVEGFAVRAVGARLKCEDASEVWTILELVILYICRETIEIRVHQGAGVVNESSE